MIIGIIVCFHGKTGAELTKKKRKISERRQVGIELNDVVSYMS